MWSAGRLLPSRVGVYFLLAMCLFPEVGYRLVWNKLTAALAGVGLEVAGPTAKALLVDRLHDRCDGKRKRGGSPTALAPPARVDSGPGYPHGRTYPAAADTSGAVRERAAICFTAVRHPFARSQVPVRRAGKRLGACPPS